MSNDDVVQIPMVATVDPCAKLRAECNRLENEKSGAEFRCRELFGERRKLREVLERLTSKLEANRRDFNIAGCHHNKYTLVIDSRNDDPVKLARATLAEGGRDA